MSKEKLKVMIVSTEVTPYAKSGGLGDVIGSLPIELIKHGVDARIVFPKYKTINDKFLQKVTHTNSFNVSLGWRNQKANVLNMNTETPTYMIENDYYFHREGFYGYGDDYERFAFFTKAVLQMLPEIDFKPDLIHFNDWQTALGPVYLNDMFKRCNFYKNIKSLYTIHNLQYQGVFARSILSDIDLNDGYFCGGQFEYYGAINYMKAAIQYSDAISTVSQTYCDEIQTYEYGYGLDGMLRSRKDSLCGILNGINYNTNNPKTDKRIFKNFDANSLDKKIENKTNLQTQLGLPVRKDVPMIAIISRLVDQKGFDLISGAIEEIMTRDIQLVILGTGDYPYESLFRYMQQRFPDKVSANITFNEELAQKIYASSDMFLMPSRFEPCGLGQIIAMRYGTVPIVRKTGGLADTVKHYDEKENPTGNGFVFNHYLQSALIWAINKALDSYKSKNWQTVVKNAINSDFSWDSSALKYIELYESITKTNTTKASGDFNAK